MDPLTVAVQAVADWLAKRRDLTVLFWPAGTPTDRIVTRGVSR